MLKGHKPGSHPELPTRGICFLKALSQPRSSSQWRVSGCGSRVMSCEPVESVAPSLLDRSPYRVTQNLPSPGPGTPTPVPWDGRGPCRSHTARISPAGAPWALYPRMSSHNYCGVTFLVPVGMLCLQGGSDSFLTALLLSTCSTTPSLLCSQRDPLKHPC